MSESAPSINRTIIRGSLGVVVPATWTQFPPVHLDEITNSIARAVGAEHAFIDCARLGRIDWLADIKLDIDESWKRVENVIAHVRTWLPAEMLS